LLKIVFVLCSLVLLCGCIILPIPHDEYVQPRVLGIVLDSANKQPITGARIVVNDSIYTITNNNGEIAISSITERKIWIFLTMDPSVCDITINITHPDYNEKSITRKIFIKDKVIDFGKIYLKKTMQ
jgi:hypothetical protein